jgi:hypothetical protein
MMNAAMVALTVLACVFGGALLGLWLQRVLPDHHLDGETKEVVRLATALIATISALVLSLLVASASSDFQRYDDELTQNAARVVMLDRTLQEYGPEADDIRAALKNRFAKRLELLYSSAEVESKTTEGWRAVAEEENLDSQLLALVPDGKVQQGLQARAVEINGDINMTYTLIHAQREDSIPPVLVIVLGAWTTLIFATFGLFAPRNPVATGALLGCAMSVAGAVFLILEMDSPFTGLITLSSAPLQEALHSLGR